MIRSLQSEDLRGLQQEGAQIVDLRTPADYADLHIPGAVHLPHAAPQFQRLAEALLDREQPVALVAGAEESAATGAQWLAECGFDVRGAHIGGLGAWRDRGYPFASAEMTVEELHRRLAAGEPLRVIDVREMWEYEQVHLPEAEIKPLSQMGAWIEDLPPDETLVFVCRSGHRSGQVVAMLRQSGRRESLNLVGGMLRWQQAGLPVL